MQVVGVHVAPVLWYDGAVFERNSILEKLNTAATFSLIFEDSSFVGPFLLNATLHSKEVDLDGIDLILFSLSLDVGGEQKDILGSSFVIKLDLSLAIEIEKPNRLPELSVISPRFFSSQPILIVSFRKGLEAFLGQMEPGGLIRSKDQSLAD